VRFLLAGVAALAVFSLSLRGARANGRFPAASYLVVGPGASSSVLALRTTFGVLRSGDAGRSWRWICEESVEAVGMFDPSIALGRDGTTALALPSGLAVSADGCAWARPANTPARPVVDVTHDATGDVLVAAVGPSGTRDEILRSDDGGHTWRSTAMLPGYFIETVEVAPSRPARVYVSAFVPGPEAVLLRSDDGGVTVREVTRDFAGGQSAWIAGVDPTDPDVLYVRSQRPGGVGTYLLRSSDGGSTFRRIAETDGAMRGFALSDDGATVWYGSSLSREGLQRSVRGGSFSRTVAQPSVQCLRFHGGRLYVCADEGVDGYALGCSDDGGDSVAPLLSLRAIETPVACPAGSSVGDRCAALWPSQRALLRAIDAGPPPDRPHGLFDVGPDALDATEVFEEAVSSRDDGLLDAPSSDGRALSPPPLRQTSCGCRAAPSHTSWWWLVALVRRRRQRRQAPRPACPET
jgi:hypothetical protein